MSATQRWFRATFVFMVFTLAIFVGALLGRLVPEYFGGAIGNIVAPASLLLVFGLVVITPEEPLLGTPAVLLWWIALAAIMTLVLVSFITYTLPYLGNMAMEAFMSAILDQMGPVDVLQK